MVTHEVILRGANPLGSDLRPLILKRTDQEFIPALLRELAVERGLERLVDGAISPNHDDRPIQLLQPVQRTFNLALLEAVCDAYAQPRLDPQRIIAAGLVLRRRAVDTSGKLLPNTMEGWQLAGAHIRGWLPLPDDDLDPDPAQRRPLLSVGHAEVNRRLALLDDPAEPLAERFSPLFVAPPEVCRAAGKTLLYGVIPVTSAEQTETPPPPPPYDLNDLRDHLPPYLRAGVSYPIPSAGATLTQAAAASPSTALNNFILTLRQVAQELDAFGDSATSRAIFAQLNGVTLDANTDHAQPLGDFLKQASLVLVNRQGLQGGAQPTVRMPTVWPALDAQRAQAILTLVQTQLSARLASITAGEGRFDQLNRQYRLRAFIRVKPHDEGCPPETVWSSYSEPFTIAPWYASGELPPLQIALPNVLDANALRQLKPNVAFAVPKQLFNFLQANDPKNLLKGEGSNGSGGFVFDWICSFNIPIITLCAFIVLNIFLSLFDLIFQWMMFIKICIPVPRSKS
jgi:hypothetical protein